MRWKSCGGVGRAAVGGVLKGLGEVVALASAGSDVTDCAFAAQVGLGIGVSVIAIHERGLSEGHDRGCDYECDHEDYFECSGHRLILKKGLGPEARAARERPPLRVIFH